MSARTLAEKPAKAMSNPHGLVVGQELIRGYRRSYPRDAPEEFETVTVAKVGRDWATLTEPEWRPERISLATLSCERRGGRCYLSKEHYAQAQREEAAQRDADKAWDEFRKVVGYRRPEHLATEAIETMTRWVTGSALRSSLHPHEGR